MPTEIKMPQLGESVHEGTIGRWLKQPGERVAKYEPLVEVITDKVNVEMPSPFAGVLRRVLVDEGATVVVGTAIAVIDELGGGAQPGPAGTASAGTGTASPPAPAAPAPAAVDGARSAPRPGREGQGPRLTPVVRRLAEEHHITPEQLAAIPGSGESGRVTKEDVLRYLEARAAPPGGPAPATPAAPPVPAVSRGPVPVRAAGDELHPLSAMRRAIAERMAQSAREIPHAYGTIEVDMAALVRHREAHKAGWQVREGVNVSITAFLVAAATRSLRAFPMVNATFTAEGILYKQAIHFGVGVAVPDGLIVPVIKHADQKGVAALARELARLAGRAREGRLTLDDVSGGTFTLTNPGVFGSVTSMPIINYPQAAILAADAIVRRPVVLGEGIAIREIMHLGLAFDHRIFDGAVAMQFLTHIKRQLEEYAPAGDSPEL